MRLPEALLNDMHAFFISYKHDDIDDEDDFFSTHRKSIKLFVDTIWEQLVEPVVGIKPKNAQHARRLVNIALRPPAPSSDVENVFSALSDVLSDYEILESKDYIGFENQIRRFIKEPLAHFCATISKLPDVVDSVPAKRLVAVLKDIPDATD